MKVEKLYQNFHPDDRASYFLTEVICGDIVRQNQTLNVMDLTFRSILMYLDMCSSNKAWHKWSWPRKMMKTIVNRHFSWSKKMWQLIQNKFPTVLVLYISCKMFPNLNTKVQKWVLCCCKQFLTKLLSFER